MDGLQNRSCSSYLHQPVSAVSEGETSLSEQEAAAKFDILLSYHVLDCESPYPILCYLDQFIQCLQPVFDESGWPGIGRILSNWPDGEKGKIWFSILCHFIFSDPDAYGLVEVLGSIIDTISQDQTYQAIYRSILMKLLENRSYLSSECFIKFMDWLVKWNVFEDHPCHNLLMHVPVRQRLTRPDLPEFPETDPIASRAYYMCCDGGCWGGRSTAMEDRYFPHTVYAHHAAMLALLDHAPETWLFSLLDHWLNKSDTVAVRERLFAPRQHPLSVIWNETRPWNILLPILKRILPKLTSGFLRDMEQLEKPVPFSEDDSKKYLQGIGNARKLVFGRTVGFLKDQESVYLKFKSGNESDEDFLQQAFRYQFAFNHGKAMGLSTEFARLAGVLKFSNLQETLASLSLNRQEQATVCMKSTSKDLLSICGEVFGRGSKPGMSFYRNGHNHHDTSFVDDSVDGPVLNRSERNTLASYLIKNARYPALAMVLQTPPECHNEKYVYQAETPDQALQDLTAFAHDFSCLFRFGIIGPDICSAFHDFSKNRGYLFLPPYFERASTGSIELWSTLSTDFPNAGCSPFIMRDMGDIKGARESLVGVKLPEPDTGKRENIIMLHSLAKAVWGAVLLYGRVNKSRFDHTSDDCISSVKSDIAQLLSTFFINAFGMEKSRCLDLLEHNHLLAQTAREISYWMSANYVADLRKGEIPVSVYPHYPGKRTGLYLCDEQREFLKDDGFRGCFESVQLGGRNGRNPIMALDALVVYMLSHGCLHLKQQKGGGGRESVVLLGKRQKEEKEKEKKEKGKKRKGAGEPYSPAPKPDQ